MAKISTESEWDSNLEFRINPDPNTDVCRIAPKMLPFHCLVDIIHCDKFCEKSRRVTL